MTRRAARFTVFPAALSMLAFSCALREPQPARTAATPLSATALSPADLLLLHAASAVLNIAPRMEQAWPGFWTPGSSFIIYRPGEAALLVSPIDPPAGFLPLSDPSMPNELRGRAYLQRGPLPGLEGAFHIDFPAGGTTATAVALDAAGPPWTLNTLFHEAFHGFQRRRFARESSSVGEFVDPSQIAAPEFRAMAEVERRMLAAALELPLDSARTQLGNYLAVRYMRARSVTPEVRAVERRLERLEGSAHLVGLHARLLARDGSSERMPDELRLYLTSSLDTFPGGLPERLIRWRVYGTGATLGFMLDRLGVDWRARMEAGATFDDLVAEAVRFDSSTAPTAASHSLERHGFEELLAQAAPGAGVSAPGSIAGFHRLAPARVTVDLDVPIENGRPQMTLNFSAGSGGFSHIEANVFGIPDPEVFTLQVPGASLVVRGRPVVQDMREMHRRRLRVTVMLPSMPAIEEGQSLAPGGHRRERVEIAVEGMQLRIDSPVTIRMTPGEMLIRGSAARQPAAVAPPALTELAHLQTVIDATGFRGTVVVHDVRRDRHLAVYGDGARTGRLPASTFKILNALVALELGLVQDARTVLPWDSIARERTELNRDLDLRSAFQISAVPHFQRLARLAGPERMRDWLWRTNYGNRDIGGGIEEFWLSGALRISPVEQVRLLNGLRTGALPFTARSQEIVREIMVVERTADHVLRAKTGWTRGDWGSTGWWVGWLERGEDAFVFATALDSSDPRADFGQHRQAVTRAVLRDLGALP